MDNKLTLMGELIEAIKQIRQNSFYLQEHRLFQANVLADDVIQKLIYLRNLCTNGSINAQDATVVMKKSVRQYLSRRGSLRETQMINLKTEAILNDDDGGDLVAIAQNAFNNENYAKCVRTVERIAALQQSKLNLTLMDLCHKAYKKVVQSAPTNGDRLKLCEWWRLFVESTALDDSSNEALLRQIDCRIECLQERLKLARTVNEKMSISEVLIVGFIEAYETAAQGNVVPFSVTNLKKQIYDLCSMISDYLRNFSGLGKLSLVVEEGTELLRLIHSEAKDEFDGNNDEGNVNNTNRRMLAEIMEEIRLVLQHCTWYDDYFLGLNSRDSMGIDQRESISNQEPDQTASISIQDSTVSNDQNPDDIIDARF